MRSQCIQIVLALLIFPTLVSAELYRYTDERGVIHFTDNYIEIPQDQRSKVEIINRLDETAPLEVKTEMGPAEGAQPAQVRPEGLQAGEGTDTQAPESASERAPSAQQFEDLVQTKANLDKIYRALAAEKEALEKEQTTLKTIESMRAFQDKATLFNKRLADYEQQRQAFQVRADAYNKLIAK